MTDFKYHVPALPDYDAPTDKPHIGVLTASDPPSVLGLPPGAVFYLIEDPKDVSKIIPIVLVRADRKEMVFACACNKQGCTRYVSYKARWGGRHVHGATR